MTDLEKEIMTELNNNLINTEEKLIIKLDEMKNVVMREQDPELRNHLIKQIEKLEDDCRTVIKEGCSGFDENVGYRIMLFYDHFEIYETYFDFFFWEDAKGDVAMINVDTRDTRYNDTGSDFWAMGLDLKGTVGHHSAGASDAGGMYPKYKACTINGWQKIENPLLRRFFRNQECIFGEVLYIADEK